MLTNRHMKPAAALLAIAAALYAAGCVVAYLAVVADEWPEIEEDS